MGLKHLCEKFRRGLFAKLPKVWDCLTEFLMPARTEDRVVCLSAWAPRDATTQRVAAKTVWYLFLLGTLTTRQLSVWLQRVSSPAGNPAREQLLVVASSSSTAAERGASSSSSYRTLNVIFNIFNKIYN